MADAKLTALSERSAADIAAGDWLYLVNNAGGSDYKIQAKAIRPFVVVDAAGDLQDAIDSLHTAGGGTILLPPGVYSISTGLTLEPDVAIRGAGIGATIIRATADIVMATLANTDDNGATAYGWGLYDLTLDGDDTASTGLLIQRYYAWQVHRVRFMDFVNGSSGNGEGVLLKGAPVGEFYGCHATGNVVGFWGEDHDNSSNIWFSNLVNFYGGRHEDNSGWAVHWDTAAGVQFRGVNFEFCGTAANDSTGVCFFDNMCATTGTGEGIAAMFDGCWFERNLGYAAIYFGAPANSDSYLNVTNTMSRFNSSNLKYGIYIADNGGDSHLHTNNVTLDEHTINDVRLGDGHWHRGPGTHSSNSTGSGTIYSYGTTADSPSASWSTFASEDFEGVTPPALPTSVTAHADFETSSSGPIGGSISLIDTDSASNERVCVFDNQDGNSGDARMTARVHVASGAAAYSQIAVVIRSDNASAPAANYYTIYVYDEGAGALQVRCFKRVSGSNTNFGTARALAFNTSYDIMIEAVGTAIRATVQRVSDGQWLDSSGTFGASPVDFLSTTDSGVTGQGYGGIQVYRESGAAVIKADNFLMEIYS